MEQVGKAPSYHTQTVFRLVLLSSPYTLPHTQAQLRRPLLSQLVSVPVRQRTLAVPCHINSAMHRDPAGIIVRVGLLGEHRVLGDVRSTRRLEERAVSGGADAERAQDVPERLGAAVVLQAEGAACVRPMEQVRGAVSGRHAGWVAGDLQGEVGVDVDCDVRGSGELRSRMG